MDSPIDLNNLPKPPVCLHRAFQPSVEVQVFNDRQDNEDIGYMVSLSMVCGDCAEGFWWPGLRTGQSFSEPRVTPDGARALLPMRPTLAITMPVDEIPDINVGGTDKEAQAAAISKALMAPEAFALQTANETPVQFRTRAILNALEMV